MLLSLREKRPRLLFLRRSGLSQGKSHPQRGGGLHVSGRPQRVPEACAHLHANFGEARRTLGEPRTCQGDKGMFTRSSLTFTRVAAKVPHIHERRCLVKVFFFMWAPFRMSPSVAREPIYKTSLWIRPLSLGEKQTNSKGNGVYKPLRGPHLDFFLALGDLKFPLFLFKEILSFEQISLFSRRSLCQSHRTSVTKGFLAGILLCNSGPS